MKRPFIKRKPNFKKLLKELGEIFSNKLDPITGIRAPSLLVYDIETCLLRAKLFRPGKQVIRSSQLEQGYFYYTHIMCITYRWAHENETRILTWGENEEDEMEMMRAFDTIIKQADVVIGKNSNRFDNKHINTQRLLYQFEGMPDWTKYTDDLQVQMKKYLALPSYGLDYYATLLGLGGKNKMEYGDWNAMCDYRIVQCIDCTGKIIRDLLKWMFGKSYSTIVREGQAATTKMFTYGMKDTTDTIKLIAFSFKHFEWKYHAGAQVCKKHLVCRFCGSENVEREKTKDNKDQVKIANANQRYHRYRCLNHDGYAGRVYVSKKTGKLGKLS